MLIVSTAKVMVLCEVINGLNDNRGICLLAKKDATIVFLFLREMGRGRRGR